MENHLKNKQFSKNLTSQIPLVKHHTVVTEPSAFTHKHDQ
jgi:hypothetical protein